MDMKRGIRIPVYGLGCGGSGATTIERVLAATGGRRKQAAEILGISERNLYRKLRESESP